MDRRKKKTDVEVLRKFRNEFYANIDNNQLSLVEAIKAMRKLSCYTQQEFADFCEVSVKIIKDMERGGGNPTLKTLNRISDFFGLEISYVRKKKESE